MAEQNKKTISEIIDNAVKNNSFGKNFKFRTDQRETIESICNAYLQNPDGYVIVDAPTGSGKSLIAMWASYVMKELGARGYLVTSDLSLQSQYESDFKKLNLNWPSIKGADNYECIVNNMPFSLGDCKLKGLSMAETKELSCYPDCEYLQKRERASEQPIALLNYSYWLIQRNYVARKMEEEEKTPPFEKRDFIFFDEGHKVDQIVQNHFSPNISNDFLYKIESLNKFLSSTRLKKQLIKNEKFNNIITKLLKHDSKQQLLDDLRLFRDMLATYNNFREYINGTVKSKFNNVKTPKSYQKAISIFDHIKDQHCKIEDYIEIIENNGIDSMVYDRDQTHEESIKFMCVEERQMITKHLHNQSGFKVFMSATIGDPKTYMRVMGISNAKVIRLNNTFEYKKSPIIFINRHKLNYNSRDKNLPKVLNILDKILQKKHINERGIIHTGSYYFSQYIKNNSKFKDRILDYTNSNEKEQVLEEFIHSTNKILIGPSLLEGLDLKDNVSRFQIFFKVPYPSLNNPLTQAKMNKLPGWYDWKTLCNVSQGIGRSVRSKDDWAVTYILDACFNQLIYKEDMLPSSFKERLEIIN
jgi:Rad3-related DNA helicase